MLTYSVKIRPSRDYRGSRERSFLPSSSSARMIFHLEIEGVFIIANASLWRDDGERGCGYYFAVPVQYNKAQISGSEGEMMGGYKHSHDTALPFMVAMRDVCTHTHGVSAIPLHPLSTPSCHLEWGW